MPAAPSLDPTLSALLRRGMVIPAHPLALDGARRLDERRQRALTRYYLAAGAGGLAVGVHTTQFAIRRTGMLKPVLALAAEEAKAAGRPVLKLAGVCGATAQAVSEAELARDLGYDAGLLSLAALRDATHDELMRHAAAVAEVIPLFGFYLQPAVGGRVLDLRFWARFVEIPSVIAIKIAPFDRYRTLEVMRAVAESGRAREVALYTGNDDNIVADLLTEYGFGEVRIRMVGGLLGQWAVGTRRAVELLAEIQAPAPAVSRLLARGTEITDLNAALFDAANGFRGCIAGIHEVLRRQGLLEGTWCLDSEETLSHGQSEAIDRVLRLYPHWSDDDFVARHRDAWLR